MHVALCRITLSGRELSLALSLALAMLFVGVGCRQKSSSAAPTPSADDYMDLNGASNLIITVPYFSSGGYITNSGSIKEADGTLTVSDSHLIGFQLSRYAIRSNADGKVRLKFKSATTTANGKSALETREKKMPFALPRTRTYARLVYFVRSSQADHNMAIVASNVLADLNAFTSSLKIDPSICQRSGVISCIWVPPGIAVRAE